MRAVVAGNYSISAEQVAMHLLQQLASMPIDVEILLRTPLSGHPGPVEELTASICSSLGIPSHWRAPQPGGGREATLERDFEMVDEAGYVLIYFDAAHVMDPERGTTRLVERALSTGTPVHAYVPEAVGEPVWVGGLDEQVSSAGGTGHRAAP